MLCIVFVVVIVIIVVVVVVVVGVASSSSSSLSLLFRTLEYQIILQYIRNWKEFKTVI